MNRRYTPRAEDYRSRRIDLESVDQRVTALEREQRLLENTLYGLAREAGVAVSGPCSRCDSAYMLAKRGVLYCPTCSDRRSI